MPSSLASMPYQLEANSQSPSHGSFGVRLTGTPVTIGPGAYQYPISSSSSSYSTAGAYSEPSSQEQASSYYGDDSPAVPSTLPVGSTSQSGYEDGSYPYEDNTSQIRGTTANNSASSQKASTSSIGRASPSGSINASSGSRSSATGSSGGFGARPGTPTAASSSPNNGNASPSLMSSGRNWTREFYAVQSTISRGGALDTVEVMDKLTKMTENFTQDAIAYGAVIIKEQHLPVERKTIKPVGVGGIAGGQKFVHEGIFFKFPTNDHDLYGNLENAMKGAGHEMKGLTGLINWELKTIGLHMIKFPLTAIIDYYGYRLVATAVLPLSSKTMVIGSGDAGRTVMDGSEHNREPAKGLAQLLVDWGKYLNVAPHDVQQNSLNKKIVKVSICFDLEGHIGTDGNYYMCDFARTFPPADQMGVPGRFLYRLLRPEFVKKYRKPISSDSFLAMQVDKSLNTTTIEATKYLMTEWLIEAVKLWNKMKCIPPPKVLSIMLHQSGINCRFLRLVAAVVQDPMLKKAVHAEIIARTMKSVIRHEIRESRNLEERNVFSIITKWTNTLFSDSEDSSQYWSNELQQEIMKRFDSPTEAFFDTADHLLSNPSSASSSPVPSPVPSPASSLPNSSSSVRNKNLVGKEDFEADSPSKPTRKAVAKKTTPSRAKLSSSASSPSTQRTPAKRTGKRASTASSATSHTTAAKTTTRAKELSASGEATLSSPSMDRYSAGEFGVRRSTRQRKVKDPGQMDEWRSYNEEEDADYDPTLDSASDPEDDDHEDGVSSVEEEELPSRYAVAYGEEWFEYGDDQHEEDELKKSKPHATKKTTSKSSNAATSATTTATASSIATPSSKDIYVTPADEDEPQSTPSKINSSTPSSSSAASLLTPTHMASPSPHVPVRHFSVRIDRNRGILRDQVNLEMLFVRLQDILGCHFDVSGLLKFRCTLNYIERSVKPIVSADGTQMAPNPLLQLGPSDVREYVPRIKQMFLTPFQTAFRYKKEADETEDFDHREQLLRLSSEAYLECLERNPLGDFALHNAARVFADWLPFFPIASSNEAQCIQYLAIRFAKLAEQQNKDLSGFKGDIYKTSDLIEPRTGRVLTKKHVEWCSEGLIKNLVLRKMEFEEIVADVRMNATPESAEAAELEIRCMLRNTYDLMFDDFATKRPKEKGKPVEHTVERKVAMQYWKMLRRVIQPQQEQQLDALIAKLSELPTDIAFLTKHHWERAAQLIF